MFYPEAFIQESIWGDELQACFFSAFKSLMNPGNVGCSWSAKCRFLRKVRHMQCGAVPTVLHCCWGTAKGKSSLQKDVNHRPSCSYIFVTLIVNIHQLSRAVAWHFAANLIFPSPVLQQTSYREPLQGMPRSACRSRDWLLSSLELSHVQLHPPSASPHRQAAIWLSLFCQRCLPCMWLAVTLQKDKSSLCSALTVPNLSSRSLCWTPSLPAKRCAVRHEN